MTAGAHALAKARRDDTERRRRQVQAALDRLTAAGEELTVAAVARAAKVSRSFLYRHNDLRARVLERAAASEPAGVAGTRMSRASLLAELANYRERNVRLARQVAKLERKLSQLLGEQVFHASGLGVDDNLEQLHRRVATLEDDNRSLREAVEHAEDELLAARTVNRELMAELNRHPDGR